MAEPLNDEEAIAALCRAGLWALFAAASLHSGAEPRPNDTHTTPAERAAQDADRLLDAFYGRLEEMLR